MIASSWDWTLWWMIFTAVVLGVIAAGVLAKLISKL